MKNLIVFLFCLLNLYCFGQSEIKIFELKKGEIFVTTDTLINCETFIMNDSSTLVVKSPSFKLQALESRIGMACKIIGDGLDGVDGKDGVSYNSGDAGTCNSGRHGGNGGTGENGRSASNIYIRTDFISIGDLMISAKGGKGGKGGNGGRGQKGGKVRYDGPFLRCGGGNGGNGGDAGKAGVGGNGGIVEISYSLSDKYIMDKIKIAVARGENGFAGQYGAAGQKGTGTDKRDGVAGKQINQDMVGKDGSVSFRQYDDFCLEEHLNETHAVIISVSNYEIPEPEWNEEAKKLYTTLTESYVFASVDTIFNPSYSELFAKLNVLSSKSGNYLIYLSGHGVKLNEKSFGFLLPDKNIMSFANLANFINNSEANTMLFLLQCCYSGKLFNELDFNTSSPTVGKLKLPENVCGKNSRILITAGYEDQSVDIKMTSALNAVLRRNEKPHLTASELFLNLILNSGYDLKDNPVFGSSNKFREGDYIIHKKQ